MCIANQDKFARNLIGEYEDVGNYRGYTAYDKMGAEEGERFHIVRSTAPLTGWFFCAQTGLRYNSLDYKLSISESYCTDNTDPTTCNPLYWLNNDVNPLPYYVKIQRGSQPDCTTDKPTKAPTTESPTKAPTTKRPTTAPSPDPTKPPKPTPTPGITDDANPKFGYKYSIFFSYTVIISLVSIMCL